MVHMYIGDSFRVQNLEISSMNVWHHDFNAYLCLTLDKGVTKLCEGRLINLFPMGVRLLGTGHDPYIGFFY